MPDMRESLKKDIGELYEKLRKIDENEYNLVKTTTETWLHMFLLLNDDDKRQCLEFTLLMYEVELAGLKKSCRELANGGK